MSSLFEKGIEESRKTMSSLLEKGIEESRKTMTILSNKISKEELKPGDHVYSWRFAYTYAHHGIYFGDEMVIHYTRGGGQEVGTGTVLDRFILSSSPSNTDIPCPRCGDKSNSDGVITSCLDCFLSGGDLYRFQYSVSPAIFLANARGGTCTLAASDSPEDSLFRARYLLQNGFGDYDIFNNNCEDFAIYCKTGLHCTGRSGQAASFRAAGSAVGSISSPPLQLLTTSFPGLAVDCGGAIFSSSLRLLTTSFPGLVVVCCGMYCVRRLVSDIGVRRDVLKIPVDQMWMSSKVHRR